MSEENINEKVNIDGRTRAYRETVMRLEQARKLREQRKGGSVKENKFNGIYNDGTGRGAIMPEPVDFTFHEAMKMVDNYKKLREKKKTLMSNMKKEESVEQTENVLDEASDMMLRSWIRNNYPKADNAKFNKIYSAMSKQYKKDPKGYTHGGGFSKVAKDARIKEDVETQEEELSTEQKKYRDFFEKALRKFGATSPAKMSDDEKKKFFNYVDKNWKG
jgi:hypothetical protein